MEIVEGKRYRRISSGEILSGEQVLFQLSQIANPQLKAVLLADVEVLNAINSPAAPRSARGAGNDYEKQKPKWEVA